MDRANVVPGWLTCLSVHPDLGLVLCIMCKWIEARADVSCNDRIFPHLAQPRQNGDRSFHRPLQRGCCSSDTHHAYKAGTPIGEYHSDSFEPQVLLIDAGGEWQNYASDITRTVPVGNGGRFTKEAGEIYDLVLRMQKVCPLLCKLMIGK